MTSDATADPPRVIARVRGLYVASRSWLEAIPLSLFLLALRIGAGLVFFTSGRIKIITWDFTIRLFTEEFKVPVLTPELAATLASICELTFPPFLFIGLATRLATLPLLGMLAVIQIFVYPDSWPDTMLWGGSLLLILSRGSGAFSIDALIERSIVIRSARLAVLATALIATAGSVALWYFAYSDAAHAGLICLIVNVPQCATGELTGHVPIAAWLPYSPALIWFSLSATVLAFAWAAVAGDIRSPGGSAATW